MANGAAGTIIDLLKTLFGDVPAQWVRLAVLIVFVAWAAVTASNFTRDMQLESKSVREALSEYVASNEAWQRLNQEQRDRLVKQADQKFRRLYKANGWDYEEMVP